MFADRIGEQVASKIGGKSQSPNSLRQLKPDANPGGCPPRTPRKGGKGLRGIRYDLLHGTLTVRELTMMSPSAIAVRYRVTRSGAKYCRSYIAKHGVT